YYKSMTKDENWCPMIRQKINNIYTRYFDKEVILSKEYMDLLSNMGYEHIRGYLWYVFNNELEEIE
ncbi:hypothetical protein, partial [Phocaeicola sartorii]|uniref:hypothetical protein n=1 Tax=Phocaeicola sartorii TaxID=671267 RepID=UPI00262A5D45